MPQLSSANEGAGTLCGSGNVPHRVSVEPRATNEQGRGGPIFIVKLLLSLVQAKFHLAAPLVPLVPPTRISVTATALF